MTTCATASPRWTRRASRRAATAGSTTTRRTSWRASTWTTRRPDSLCGACRTACRRIPASRPSGCGGGASRSGRRASRCTASASSGRSGEAPSAASHAEFRMPTRSRLASRLESRIASKESRLDHLDGSRCIHKPCVTSAVTCSAVRTTVQVGPDLAMSARQSDESAPSMSPSDHKSSNGPDVTEAGLDATSAWTSSERPNDRAGVIVTPATGSGRCGMAREDIRSSGKQINANWNTGIGLKSPIV